MPKFYDNTALYEKASKLLYNEYICYDVGQVRLRYLFRVTMFEDWC